MADIKDCIGKNIKISKCSITIKSNDGKTCGVVRDIRKFRDIQQNKVLDGELRETQTADYFSARPR